MEKYKFLILGAGPAGLTFANRLQQNAEESFLVLEKEKEAGDEFAVYSVRSGEVVVASSVGSLASVKVYTVGGVLMAEETCAEGTTMCRLAVKGNENYVVQVTNVYGKKADVKLHVK